MQNEFFSSFDIFTKGKISNKIRNLEKTNSCQEHEKLIKLSRTIKDFFKFLSSIFLTCLKEDKNGQKNITNYHAVSILATLTDIYERLINDHLNSGFDL